MNEQNVKIEITAEVKGVIVPDANIKINSITIGSLTIPNVNVA